MSLYVLEIHAPGRPPWVEQVSVPKIVLGRQTGDIVLHDPKSSSSHAEVEFENGRLIVRDLGSTNGTWKGTRALPQFVVVQGESFRCADTNIIVKYVEGVQHQASGGTVMGGGVPIPGPASAPTPQVAPSRADPQVPSPPASPSSGLGLGIAVSLAVLLVAGAGVGGYGYWSGWFETSQTVVARSPSEPDDSEVKSSDANKDAPSVVEADLGGLYRDVAAATVVIRTPGSVGSGSVIDPLGVILTNHHVIQGAERDGLQAIVNVTLGEFSSESNAFEPAGEALKAEVIKIDTAHDLALIRLLDPPADLPSLSMAEAVPYPGQRVAALGHAGAGMLWAIKGGEISATGALSAHAALALENSQGDERDHLARLKDQFDKKGRVIQSTARILPGDSGGPLVGMDRKIVGVNAFGRIDEVSGQWISFHVHLAEVRAFVKDIPTHALDLVPDPWSSITENAAFADVDFDGYIDTMVVSRSDDERVVFFDLDENSVPEGEPAPYWVMVMQLRDQVFDPELVVIEHGQTRQLLIDTDHDQSMETYLWIDGDERLAYTVTEDGEASRNAEFTLEERVPKGLFRNSLVGERFVKTAGIVFPGLVDGGDEILAPDPLAPMMDAGRYDYDGDGIEETVVETSPFHERVMWSFDGGTPSAVMVTRGASRWVWYDTDGDAQLDLMLATSNALESVTWQAYNVDVGGTLSERDGFVGQLVVQPYLLSGTRGRAMRTSALRMLKPWLVATERGLSVFPTVRIVETASVEMADSGGLANRIAKISAKHHDLTLVDIDGDAIDDEHRGDRRYAAGKVQYNVFDAELALLPMGKHHYAYYDTDNDGSYDQVVIAPESGAPTDAYRVMKDAVHSMEPPRQLLEPGLFADVGLQTELRGIIERGDL